MVEELYYINQAVKLLFSFRLRIPLLLLEHLKDTKTRREKGCTLYKIRTSPVCPCTSPVCPCTLLGSIPLHN